MTDPNSVSRASRVVSSGAASIPGRNLLPMTGTTTDGGGRGRVLPQCTATSKQTPDTASAAQTHW
jgi:hypothetical protein